MTAALDEASQDVAETQTVWSSWSTKAAAARREAADLRQQLQSAALADGDSALSLVESIADADARTAALDALSEAARGRYETATRALDGQHGLDAAAAADELWTAWSAHHGRTLDLLGQLRKLEGVEFTVAHPDTATAGDQLLRLARAADEDAAELLAQVQAGHAVLRSGPTTGGRRQVHIGLRGHARTEPQRIYRVTVDGLPFAPLTSLGSSPLESFTWVTRDAPADAVVALSGPDHSVLTLPPALEQDTP